MRALASVSFGDRRFAGLEQLGLAKRLDPVRARPEHHIAIEETVGGEDLQGHVHLPTLLRTGSIPGADRMGILIDLTHLRETGISSGKS